MGLFDRFRRQPAPSGGARPFGFAVVGLGHIADYFMEALRDSPACTVAAVVSGSDVKARAATAKFRVPLALTYAEFDRLRDTPAVDVVYLALPVSLHREWTERAAAAGLHVLCEKPMASASAEAQAMIAACAAAGVRLSIAYRCPHAALHQRMRDLVQNGALGPAASLRIESGFGFALKPGWRDEPGLAGGGSLYDVGIYPLNASRFLLGEDPVGIEDAQAVCDGNGLERAIAWTSVFPSGARALCRSSYQEHIPDTLRITGDLGELLLAPAFSHRERYRLHGQVSDPATGRSVAVDEKVASNAASEFRLEAEALARAVREGADLLTPGEDGLADMVAMEAIYAAAGVAQP